MFSLRSDKYKYTTYYGLWDTDEFFDMQSAPMEQKNLIRDPAFAKHAKEMENRLYQMMTEMRGMDIPMNQPRGSSQNKRLRSRDGNRAANFPKAFVADKPINRNAK